tara:strand:+ start:397 stop:1020 length:624 start_codon:yes stop_codon:yes gene_type:complete
MPIIKDKYKGKGSQTRSKFLTRSKDKAISESVPVGISTEQKRELLKESYRSAPENKNQTTLKATVATTTQAGVVSQASSTEEQTKESNINSFNFKETNTVKSLFTLNEGNTLNNMIIHNYNSGGAASTIGVHWSSGDQTNISFTVSSGVITATTGATSTCLFSGQIPYLASIDLGSILNTVFKNVNKDIYFYVVSSLVGPSVTYSIS